MFCVAARKAERELDSWLASVQQMMKPDDPVSIVGDGPSPVLSSFIYEERCPEGSNGADPIVRQIRTYIEPLATGLRHPK